MDDKKKQFPSAVSKMAIKGAVAEVAKQQKVFKDSLKDAYLYFKELETVYEEYHDVIEVMDEWESITGMTISELNEMEIEKALDLIRKKLKERLPIEIEKLNSVFPKKYIMPNNKLANTIETMSQDYSIEYSLEVNKRKQVYSTVSLNYNDENIQIYEKDKRFTAYDRSVHNAICSIYEAGNTNFTADQVYRAMNGYDDQQHVSPQAIGAITKSLDKSRRINVKVDYTDEAKAYKKDLDSFTMEDYVLSAQKVTLKAGGKEVTGYKLNTKPILYQYAQLTNQVITVPSKLLNTKDVIKSTPEVIVIREYLIRRIEEMKSKKNNLGNKILFSTIYDQIDQPEPDKKKAKKVRDIVETLLNKFKTEKCIKRFEFYKEGRAFKGVEITY